MMDFAVPCRMSTGEEVVATVCAPDPESARRIVSQRCLPGHTVRDLSNGVIPGHVVEILDPVEPLSALEARLSNGGGG